MVSQIKVNEIIKQSGSSITIGESGDTISLGAALPVGSGGTGSTTLTGAGLTNKPYFKARLTSTQNNIGTSNTKVAFNERVIDSDNLFDTTNHRFLPTTAGTYFFSTSQRLYSSTASTRFTCYLFKNGSIHTRMVETNDDAETYSAFTGTAMAEANGSSDYFEIYVNISNNTADITGDPSDQSWGFFEGFKLI
jgi:hypothetical protein